MYLYIFIYIYIEFTDLTTWLDERIEESNQNNKENKSKASNNITPKSPSKDRILKDDLLRVEFLYLYLYLYLHTNIHLPNICIC